MRTCSAAVARYGTGAAADLGAGETQRTARNLGYGHRRLDRHSVLYAIDLERNFARSDDDLSCGFSAVLRRCFSRWQQRLEYCCTADRRAGAHEKVSSTKTPNHDNR